MRFFSSTRMRLSSAASGSFQFPPAARAMKAVARVNSSMPRSALPPLGGMLRTTDPGMRGQHVLAFLYQWSLGLLVAEFWRFLHACGMTDKTGFLVDLFSRFQRLRAQTGRDAGASQCGEQSGGLTIWSSNCDAQFHGWPFMPTGVEMQVLDNKFCLKEFAGRCMNGGTLTARSSRQAHRRVLMSTLFGVEVARRAIGFR